MTDTLLVVDSSVIIKWLSKDNENYLDSNVKHQGKDPSVKVVPLKDY